MPLTAARVPPSLRSRPWRCPPSQPVWKSNFRRPAPSAQCCPVTAPARWRRFSTPPTRSCPRKRVCSMAWQPSSLVAFHAGRRRKLADGRAPREGAHARPGHASGRRRGPATSRARRRLRSRLRGAGRGPAAAGAAAPTRGGAQGGVRDCLMFLDLFTRLVVVDEQREEDHPEEEDHVDEEDSQFQRHEA